jgi:hypothetical protein
MADATRDDFGAAPVRVEVFSSDETATKIISPEKSVGSAHVATASLTAAVMAFWRCGSMGIATAAAALAVGRPRSTWPRSGA